MTEPLTPPYRPAVERVRELLDYDPSTGLLTWRIDRPMRRAGQVAGGLSNGYIVVSIDDRRYKAHRIAWMLSHGEWPEHFIDHINGTKTDNRIANLRDVPHRVNMQNIRCALPSNESGFLGVSPASKRFKATIRTPNGTLYLGTFSTAEVAHAAYLTAKRLLHEGCTI